MKVANKSFLDERQILVREDQESAEVSETLDVKGEGKQRSKGKGKGKGKGKSKAAALALPDVKTEKLQSTRLYVGNLAYSTSWQALKDHFAELGCEVGYAKVIEERDSFTESGRPIRKGWGIVEFDTLKMARRAMKVANKSFLDERQILVREDRESAEVSETLDVKGEGKQRSKGKGKGKGKGKSKAAALALPDVKTEKLQSNRL